MTCGRSIPVDSIRLSALEELEDGDGEESAYDRAGYDLIDVVYAGLDAALADEQGHEQSDQGDQPSESPLRRDEARCHPPPERDRRMPGGHPTQERVWRTGERLYEEHGDGYEHERDERQVSGPAPEALQCLHREGTKVVVQNQVP